MPSSAFATTVTALQTVPGSIQFNAVACASATTCVAVGYGPGDVVLVVITNGIPGPVQVISNTTGLTGVACPNPTTCLVVGNQNVTRPGMRPGSQGIVLPVINGVVGTAQPVPAVVDLNAVACASATTCYALGVAAGGVAEVVTITDGIPGTAQAVSAGIGLSAVACASATTCYAVGATADGGVVVPIVNGVPGAAQPVLTAALLQAVACASATTCYATGVSADFTQAVLVPITTGGPGDPQFAPSLGAIACPTATTCVSVGLDQNTGAVLVIPIINGIPGVTLVVPGSNGFFAVACTTATTCVAVGSNNPSQIGVVATINLPPPCTTTITGNHAGTLVIRPGLTCLSGVHLTGNIVAGRGASLNIDNSTITGSIEAIGPNAVQICGTKVAGSVFVSDAKGFVLIGDPGDDGCAINRIGGSLILMSNRHGLEAIGNHVGGTVFASGNSGIGPFPEDIAPDVSGNTR